MSAKTCGCDDDAGWICKQHSDEIEAGRVQRFAARLAADQPQSPDARRVRHCAEVLATFYRAPLSMSSVQPVLTLAEELNPGLKP